jgi:hypothetical protein
MTSLNSGPEYVFEAAGERVALRSATQIERATGGLDNNRLIWHQFSIYPDGRVSQEGGASKG